MSVGHLGHLGCGFSSEFMSSDDSGAPPSIDASTLNAFYANDTSRPTSLNLPENDEFVGYTIPLTVVGDHTTVSLVFSLPAITSTAGGAVLGDYSTTSLAAAIAASNSGWSVSVSIASGIAITFTRATLVAGSYTIDLRAGTAPTPDIGWWAQWRWGSSSSPFGGTVYGTASGAVTISGSSDQCTVVGYSNSSITVCDITAGVAFSPSPVTSGSAVQFTVYYRNEGAASSLNSITIVASPSGGTLTSPTTITNTDGWTIGSWSLSGSAYTCVATRSGSFSGTSSITFSTTQTGAGSMQVDLSASNGNSSTYAVTGSTVTVNPVTQTYYTLRKTSGSSGTYDAQSYSSTFAGNVSVFWRASWANDALLVGLSADNPDANYTGIDFGVINDTGTYYQAENGTLTSKGAVTAGDVIEIRRIVATGVVTAYKNGSSWFTFTGTSTATLRVDSSFRFTGDHATVWITDTAGGPLTTTWTSTNVTQGTVALTTNASTYAAGATITVTFSGATETLDWISLAANGSAWNGIVAYVYTNNSGTPPGSVTASGTVTFSAPTAGTYVIRLLRDDAYDAIHQSATFTTT